MNTVTAYCNGFYKGDNSAVSYIIFKDGKFLEEYVTKHNLPQRNTFYRQQTYAVSLLVDRLIELNSENVVINFSCKAVNDRIMKTYYKYFNLKNAYPFGFEKSSAYKIAKNISKFKSFKINVIPKSDNLRALFLSRKFIVENWSPRNFIWKGDYPQQS